MKTTTEIIEAAVYYSVLTSGPNGSRSGGFSFGGPLGKITVWADGIVEWFGEWPCQTISPEWIAGDPENRTGALASMRVGAIEILKDFGLHAMKIPSIAAHAKWVCRRKVPSSVRRKVKRLGRIAGCKCIPVPARSHQGLYPDDFHIAANVTDEDGDWMSETFVRHTQFAWAAWRNWAKEQSKMTAK